jgi:hypothetical protein
LHGGLGGRGEPDTVFGREHHLRPRGGIDRRGDLARSGIDPGDRTAVMNAQLGVDDQYAAEGSRDPDRRGSRRDVPEDLRLRGLRRGGGGSLPRRGGSAPATREEPDEQEARGPSERSAPPASAHGRKVVRGCVDERFPVPPPRRMRSAPLQRARRSCNEPSISASRSGSVTFRPKASRR